MKVSVLVVVVFLAVVSAQVVSIPGGKWERLDTFFGTLIPFRFGHSGACSTGGRFVSFSGRNNLGISSRSVSRYNYVIRDRADVPVDELVLDRLITLTTLVSNERDSRTETGFGLYNDQFLVLYGGSNAGAARKDVYVYDFAISDWLNVTTSLNGNAAALFENHFKLPAIGPAAAIDQANAEMWLFGGDAVISVLPYITIYHISDQSFTEVDFLTGNDASSRFGAVAMFTPTCQYTLSNGPALWIFGGKLKLGTDPVEIYNDIYLFDTVATEYDTSFTTTGTAPSPRAYMSKALRRDGRTMVLFGGINDANAGNVQVFSDVFTFDIVDGSWTTLSPANNNGDVPSGRNRALLTSLLWQDEDSILMYGGADAQGGALNDLFKLTFQTSNFTPIVPPDPSDSVISSGIVIPSSSSSVVVSSEPPPDVLSSSPASALSFWLSYLF